MAVDVGWTRLDATQREAFLRAALRLNALDLRAWLRRRLRTAPLAEPFDPANLMFGDVDIASFCGRRANLPPGRTGTRPIAAKQGSVG